MKKLVFGMVPDDFSPDTHITVGPWCFLGKEEQWPDWYKFDFEPDPFKSPQELADAGKLTTEIVKNLIPGLAEKLNLLNGTEYSDKFWEIMTAPWLITLVQITWERQKRVEKLIEKYRNEAVEVELVEDSIKWDFKTSHDFLFRGVFKNSFNEWLFSRLLENRIPETWIVKNKNLNIRTANSDSQYNIKQKTPSGFNKLWWRFNRCHRVYGVGKVAQFFLSLVLNLKPGKSVSSKDKLCESVKYQDKPEFGFDIWKLIDSTIPETLKTLKERHKLLYKAKRGKFRIVGPTILWLDNEIVKYAYAVEMGENIITTQHGGMYGTSKSYPLHNYIEYNKAAFFSWGWKKQEDYSDEKIIPLPSPYLNQLKKKYRKKGESIIMVGTRMHMFSYRLDSFPQPLEMVQYRVEKMQFFKSLREEPFKDLLYRPYMFRNDGGIQDIHFFQKQLPDLKILSGNLHEKMETCKLLVLDHPVTTLHIALSAGIPMIGFWNEEAWAMCRQAESYFQSMRDAGLIFDTGKEVAEKINEIGTDIDEWWQESKRQEAVKKWCYEYARTGNWFISWLKEIWRV